MVLPKSTCKRLTGCGVGFLVGGGLDIGIDVGGLVNGKLVGDNVEGGVMVIGIHVVRVGVDVGNFDGSGGPVVNTLELGIVGVIGTVDAVGDGFTSSH